MAQILAVCSTCGSKVESLEVTTCPTCKTHFEGEIGPEEMATGFYCVKCHQYSANIVKVEPEKLVELNRLVSAPFKVTTYECPHCQTTFEIKELVTS